MNELLHNEMLESIEKSLQDFLKAYWGEEKSIFKEMISYHMGWHSNLSFQSKGKRIRPYLLLLFCGASNGDWKKALPAAVSIEYLHNFTLIHDDIMDKSLLRHGQTTIWAKYGIAQAINAGDGLFNLSQWSMLQLLPNYSESAIFNIQDIFNHTVAHLIDGQILDIKFEGQYEIGTDDYWQMITGKTAALIKACTSIGAYLGSLDNLCVSQSSEYGLNLGLAYQVLDDLLGIWGDTQKTGKPTFSDLIERKTSLPIVYGLENDAQFKDAWICGTISTKNVSEFAKLLENIGAKAFCQNKAKEFTQNALEILISIKGKENSYWDNLHSLTLDLLSRDL